MFSRTRTPSTHLRQLLKKGRQLCRLLLLIGMVTTLLPPSLLAGVDVNASERSRQAARLMDAPAVVDELPRRHRLPAVVHSNTQSNTQSNSVDIGGEGFSPPLLVIRVGETVTWTNGDTKTRQIQAGQPDATVETSPDPIFLPLVERQADTRESPASDYGIYLPDVAQSPSRQGQDRAQPALDSSAGSPLNSAPESIPQAQALSAPQQGTDWESGPLAPGESYDRAFGQTGTFFYYDPLVPAQVGQIQVLPAAPPTPTPTAPNQPPSVTITGPQDGAVTGSTVTVSGSVTDDGTLQGVTVNGVAASLNGSQFSASVSLGGGDQSITVVATDSQGATGLASTTVRVDDEGPQIVIESPRPRQSVNSSQPQVTIRMDDFLGTVDVSSVAASLSDGTGTPVSILGDLTVTATGATGGLSSPLTEGRTYTLTVTAADTTGNQSQAQASFYVPESPESIVQPQTSDSAGWVSGTVYNSTTCDQDLTTCAGLAGATVTLEKVDPALIAQIRAQRKETIERRWLTRRSSFTPLRPRSTFATAPVTGTVVSGPDGFFAFPAVESGLYWLRVERDGFTYAQREVEIVSQRYTATSAIYLTPLDPAVTPCDDGGCSHTNSDNSMQVIVPPGAIASGDNLDITATVFDQVEFLPSGDLPPGTWETYAFNLGGDSDYAFQPGTEVTVRIANDKGFAPGTPIPLGFWNNETLAWEHAGTGVVDGTGQWVEMTVTHFSNYDCNDPISVPEIETEVVDESDDDEVQQCPEGENGCFVSLQKGTLGEEVRLPSVRVLGDDVAPSLTYNTERVLPNQLIDLKLLLDIEGSVTLGESIGFELFIEGEKTEDFTFSADLTEGEIGRFRYLWDGRNAQGELLPPGLYPYAARFRVPYQGEYCFALDGIFGNPPDCENGSTGIFVQGEEIVPVEGTLAVNTQLDSPFGAGWVLGGLQRLYQNEAGQILITDGDRMVEFYHPAADQLAQAGEGRSASPSFATEPPDLSRQARAIQALTQTKPDAYSEIRAGASTEVQGLIASNTTWTAANSPYIITSTVLVADNVTLTVEPGVTVQANTGHGLFVLGALNAQGTAGNPILFGPLAGAPNGSWNGISLGGGQDGDSDSSALAHVTIEGAGTNLSLLNTAMTITDVVLRNGTGGQGGVGLGLSAVEQRPGASLTLRRVTAENNSAGLSLNGGSYLLDDVLIQENLGEALSVGDVSTQITVQDSTIRRNLRVATLPVQAVLQNVTFAENSSSVIGWIGGTIDGNAAWNFPEIDGFQILGSVTVASGASLSIPAGTVVTFIGRDGVILNVEGALQAVGTPDESITFTTVPQPNARTGQIDLRGSGSQLANVTISGLEGSPGGLNVYGVTPQLDGLRLTENVTHGLYVENAPGLTIRNSVFADNGSHGLFNATPSVPVDAASNFWGAQSGPFHPSLNPTGVGNQVSDGVIFEPFLPAPPSLLGTIQERTADDFSELSFDETTGTYARTTPDGTRIQFDAQGRHAFTEDRTGLRISYTYEITGNESTGNGTERVTSVAITTLGEAEPAWTWTFSHQLSVAGSQSKSPETDHQLLITDPAGRTTTFDMDDNNLMSGVLFPDGTERRFFYDQRSLMTRQVDQAGDISSYAYDSYGRVASITEPPRPIYDPETDTVSVASEVRTFTPSESHHGLLNESAVGTSGSPAPAMPTTEQITDRVDYGSGSVSGRTNKWGMWLTRTDSEGRTTEYERDAENNLTRTLLPNGDCVDYTYDDVGNQLTRTERPAADCAQRDGAALAQGRQWVRTYESRFNQIKTETDPNGNTTTYVYDYEENAGEMGNLIRMEQPAVADEKGTLQTPIWRYAYNSHGQLISETDPRGVETRYIYTQGVPDEASSGAQALFLPGVTPMPGLLTQIVRDAGDGDDLNVTTTFKGFDGAGNPTVRMEPHGAIYTDTFDAMNRLIATVDPLGVETRSEYDPQGNLAQMTEDFTADRQGDDRQGDDGLNIVTTFEYNLYTQLTAQQTPGDGQVRGVEQIYDVNRNLAQVVDAKGNTTTYLYDSADQHIRTTDALSNTTTYVYDDRGQRIRTIHPDGAQDASVYDGFGRVVREIVDETDLALTTVYEYDANGNVVRMTDPVGTVTCHTFDALNRPLTRVEDCNGLALTTRYAYDVAGRLITMTDPRGVVTRYTYDDLDREVLRQYDADGLNIQFRTTYGPNGDILSTVDGKGFETRFTYDPLSRRLSERVDPDGLNLVTQFAYDALGRLISQTDPLGETTAFTVNTFGETVVMTDPLGNATRYAYDVLGNRTATTDPTGITLIHDYDALSRMTAIVNPLGFQQQFVYDGRGNLATEIDANGQTTTYTYDGAQRRLTREDALGQITRYSYDGMGRLLQETEPLNTTTIYTYDPLGRLITEQNPLGQQVRHGYDGVGNRTRTVAAIPAGGTAGDGQESLFAFDALNRLLSETDPLGNQTLYEYDANGNRTRTVDARGNATRFTYDPANRLTTIVDPLAQTTRYVYNSRGEIVEMRHANGDVITHTYDAAGREIRVAYPDGNQIQRTFDPAGRVLRAEDGVSTLTLTYDGMGRLGSVVDDRLNRQISYGYDPVGNLTALVAPDGLTIRHLYDEVNRLVETQQSGHSFRFAYDANDRLVRQLAGEAGQTSARIDFSRDAMGRATGIAYRGPDGALFEQVTYAYDAAGNRTQADTQSSGTGPVDSVRYTYDKANRLIGETRTGTLIYAHTYEYDAMGNRTRQVVDGAVTTYTYNEANQLTQETGAESRAYAYDARNRLVGVTGAETRSYSYSPRGELIQASGPGGTSTYLYDAFRRQVAQTVNGQTTNFLHDGIGAGTTILAEYGASNALQTAYALAPFVDGRLARTASGSVTYYLPDGLGSTRHLMDGEGSLTAGYRYDGFGQTVQQTGSSANPYRFAGRRWDAAAGLYDNRARQYDPRLGRFAQADPLGHIERTNLYQYAQNNPATRIDPLGWSSTDCLSLNRKTDDLLGLKAYTNRLNSLMSSLPSRPTIKASGTINVQGKLCQRCCGDEGGGDCPGCPRRDYVGSVSIGANANLGITWPLAAVGLEIRGYGFKFGIEAYGKLNASITGAGELNLCKSQATLKLCGSGSVTGGIKGGLLKWPFEVVKLEAYVYGQISGTCRACIGYSILRGTTLLESRCQACAEAGYKVAVKFFWDLVDYSRHEVFAKGCIG